MLEELQEELQCDDDRGWGGYTSDELAYMKNELKWNPDYVPEVPMSVLYPDELTEEDSVSKEDAEIWGTPTPIDPMIDPAQATFSSTVPGSPYTHSSRKRYTSRKTGWISKKQVETKECIHAEDIEIEIMMNPTMYQSLIHLSAEINTEWLGYFKGTREQVDDTITYRPTSIVFPKQEVSGSMCSPTEETHDTLGIIHSHHSMGAFFSGQDDANVNMNNDFSIVVSNGEMKAVSKVKLPCGAVIIKDADILIEVDDSIVEQVKGKLTEKTYAYSTKQGKVNKTNNKIDNKYKYRKRNLYNGYGY